MTTTEVSQNVGKRVLVEHRGFLITGILVGLDKPTFGRTDALVRLPKRDKPRAFWVSKVSKLD
jgi:hypothetical protein